MHRILIPNDFVEFPTFIAYDKDTGRRIFIKCRFLSIESGNVIVYPKRYRGINDRDTRWKQYFSCVGKRVGKWRKDTWEG